MRCIGEKVFWRGIHRTESGIIENLPADGTGYLVRLDNGRYILAPEVCFRDNVDSNNNKT